MGGGVCPCGVYRKINIDLSNSTHNAGCIDTFFGSDMDVANAKENGEQKESISVNLENENGGAGETQFTVFYPSCSAGMKLLSDKMVNVYRVK